MNEQSRGAFEVGKRRRRSAVACAGLAIATLAGCSLNSSLRTVGGNPSIAMTHEAAAQHEARFTFKASTPTYVGPDAKDATGEYYSEGETAAVACEVHGEEIHFGQQSSNIWFQLDNAHHSFATSLDGSLHGPTPPACQP